jgi:hypothetical protein
MPVGRSRQIGREVSVDEIIEEKFAEAQSKPELYRPDSDYIGMYCGPEACEYIPIERRSA